MTFYDLMTETICFRWEEKRKAAYVLYTIWIIVFSCVCVFGGGGGGLWLHKGRSICALSVCSCGFIFT